MNLLRAATLTLLLLGASAAGADEQCMVEAKTLKPQFAAKLPRGFKLVSTRKDKKFIKQVLKLSYDLTL